MYGYTHIYINYMICAFLFSIVLQSSSRICWGRYAHVELRATTRRSRGGPRRAHRSPHRFHTTPLGSLRAPAPRGVRAHLLRLRSWDDAPQEPNRLVFCKISTCKISFIFTNTTNTECQTRQVLSKYQQNWMYVVQSTSFSYCILYLFLEV